MRHNRNAYKILVRKAEGKSPLQKSIHRYENNVKIYLKIGRDGVRWIQLARSRVYKSRSFLVRADTEIIASIKFIPMIRGQCLVFCYELTI